MANTTIHTANDVDVMTIGDLSAFKDVDYAGLQEYARLRHTYLRQVADSQTTAAAATLKTLQSRRQRFF